MKNKIYLGLFSAAAFLFGAEFMAHACSVCVTGANDPTADAYNASVLFLMATPYAVLGSIGGGLFLAYRRRVSKAEAPENDPTTHDLDLNEEGSGR
jgi:hypothetical protein